MSPALLRALQEERAQVQKSLENAQDELELAKRKALETRNAVTALTVRESLLVSLRDELDRLILLNPTV
jgi:hypothetical protein